MTVRRPATPGMMPLRPPLKPAKKCGSIKPGDDADIGLDKVAVEQGGGAVARRAEGNQRGGILGFVVQDAVVLHDCRRQQLSSSARVLGRCVPRALSSVMFSGGTSAR